MDIDDPLLEQSIYQVVFEACMFEYFSEFSTNTSDAGNEVTNQGVVSLTADELNVVRYVGRFVARSLLKKKMKRSEKKARCILSSLTVWEKWLLKEREMIY